MVLGIVTESARTMRRVHRLTGGGAFTANNGRFTTIFATEARVAISSSPTNSVDYASHRGRHWVESSGSCQEELPVRNAWARSSCPLTAVISLRSPRTSSIEMPPFVKSPDFRRWCRKTLARRGVLYVRT